MRLKVRLTLIFAGINLVLLVVLLGYIYFSYANFRKEQFFLRLKEKSLITARFLSQAHRIDQDILRVFDLNTIHEMLDEKILIFDQNNALIYSSLDDEPIHYDDSLLAHIRHAGEIRFIDDDKDETVGIYFREDLKEYVILASAFDKFGHDKLRNLRNTLLIALTIGIMVIALAAYYYIRIIFRPIRQLNTAIQNITEGRMDQRLPVADPLNELEGIAHNFNLMVDRLSEAFRLQRNFVHNASHELKTPVATVISLLEKALEQPPATPEELHRFLASTKEEHVRMVELIEGMLLLQRLSNRQDDIRLGRVRMDEVLFDSLEEVRSLHEALQATIDFPHIPENEGLLSIHGNAMLLRIAFGNLLRNAWLYHPQHEVHITVDASGEGIRLQFSNTGQRPLDAELLFQPFYRDPDDSTTPGHGLGLSIVREVMVLHGGTVEYRFVDGEHRFELWFPG